jgi:hypothetical protein
MRLTMYRCYLYLIMAIEGPTRGHDPVTHADFLRYLRGQLVDQLNLLQRGPAVA